MMRIKNLCKTMILFIASSVAMSSSLKAQTDPKGEIVATVTIVNKNSGKPLNVIGSNPDRNCRLEQNSGNLSSQQWVVSKGIGSSYYINNKNSGLYMDCNSSQDAAPVQQMKYIEHTNNLWEIIDRGNGFYSFTNVHSKKTMSIVGSSKDDGALIEQNAYTGADNQLFSLGKEFAAKVAK